jgi:hypothetical protein
VHDTAAQALQGTRNAVIAWHVAAAWLIVAGYTSINAVVKAELFPTNVRATGVGVRRTVTVSIFGGLAEFAGALVQVDRPRGVVLVLPHGSHRRLAHCLRLDARHEARIRDGSPRIDALPLSGPQTS